MVQLGQRRDKAEKRNAAECDFETGVKVIIKSSFLGFFAVFTEGHLRRAG